MSDNKKKPLTSKKSTSKKKSTSNTPIPQKDSVKNVNFYWIYAVVGVLLLGMIMLNSDGGGSEIQFSEFKSYVESDDVDHVIHDGHVYKVYLTESAKEDLVGSSDDDSRGIMGLYAGPDVWFSMPPGDSYTEDYKQLTDLNNVNSKYEPVNEWGQQMFSWVFFLVIMIVVWMFIMKRMSGGGAAGNQIFSIGKSKAKLHEKGDSTDITFADVAGVDEAKEELEEIVDFLMKPSKYTKLGAKIPKGALLVGPPGTGKTLLAKAVAGEAKVPFFSLSGSDFVEMFVGVGASRVRDLFKQAKEKAPSIIFIDEIDAIGRARGKNASFSSNDERENTLNQLLTEMDGFGSNSGVIIIAATNRADVLDKALLRAGRFDRQIYVDMPDINERKAIFKVHLKPIKTDKTVDIDLLSKQTPGFSGADIANVCNEAALFAARKRKNSVSHTDFNEAVDRIVGGLEKRSRVISDTEKKTIAFHEAGHAIVSWLLRYASPLMKVSIIPRGKSLGAAWYLPHERQITTTEQIFHEMCAAMGGRAAEKIMFNKISTGALSDLEKVTKQAQAMVTVYGLNDKIGNISYYDSRGEQSFTKPYSEATARIIDEEVSKVIEQAYVKAQEILNLNKNKLTELAEALLKDEVIFKVDVERILGPRPFEEEVVGVKLIEEPPNVVRKVKKKPKSE
ncbi:MAG: ATP-dependent zinc metalloprotease FtsH [Bacteroidetes bacterium]|nr:ATP-dependent zinc metalloprotease FtsH [Bacteroidota bacterium]MDA0980507.1 ATP-dependent zinc metalloprotease FtsH [Bacteroidota bacterium]